MSSLRHGASLRAARLVGPTRVSGLRHHLRTFLFLPSPTTTYNASIRISLRHDDDVTGSSPISSGNGELFTSASFQARERPHSRSARRFRNDELGVGVGRGVSIPRNEAPHYPPSGRGCAAPRSTAQHRTETRIAQRFGSSAAGLCFRLNLPIYIFFLRNNFFFKYFSVPRKCKILVLTTCCPLWSDMSNINMSILGPFSDSFRTI